MPYRKDIKDSREGRGLMVERKLDIGMKGTITGLTVGGGYNTTMAITPTNAGNILLLWCCVLAAAPVNRDGPADEVLDAPETLLGTVEVANLVRVE